MKHYRLGDPNRKVRQSLTLALVDVLAGEDCNREEYRRAVDSILRTADHTGLKDAIKVALEDSRSHGRLDRAVLADGGVYLFE